MTRSPPAYALEVDFTGQRDSTCVLHMVQWAGWANLRWSATAPLSVPDPIVYRVGSRRIHSLTDYPSTFGVRAVFTRRMLDALLAIRPFGYRLYPVEIQCRGQVVPAPSTELTFWLVQLTEHFDGFDAEQSDWEPSDLIPWMIEEVYRLELNVPPEGLPPIFRIPQRPTRLMVSAEGRDALLTAGIRGVGFKSCLELEDQEYKQIRIASGRYRPPPTSRPS